MSDDYGYINARIRALRSFLLREEDYAAALRQRSEDQFTSFLASLSSYASDVHAVVQAEPVRSAYDKVLSLNMCRTFRKIIRFSEGEPGKLILILLRPWDVYNIKTILRGLIGSQEKGRIIEALVPAGKWDLEFLSRLVKSEGLKGLASELARAADDSLGKEFSRVISGFPDDGQLELLENNLDCAYFGKASEDLSNGNASARVVLDYLSLKVDLLNIRLALKKAMKPGVPIVFVKGGAVSGTFLKEAAACKTVEEVLGMFAHSPHSWLAEQGLELFKRTRRLSSLERLLEKRLFSFCRNVYRGGDPLSVSIPLGFINFKENEVRSLRLIGKGIAYDMPEDLIREEIVFAS